MNDITVSSHIRIYAQTHTEIMRQCHRDVQLLGNLLYITFKQRCILTYGEEVILVAAQPIWNMSFLCSLNC